MPPRKSRLSPQIKVRRLLLLCVCVDERDSESENSQPEPHERTRTRLHFFLSLNLDLLKKKKKKNLKNSAQTGPARLPRSRSRGAPAAPRAHRVADQAPAGEKRRKRNVCV